MSLAIPFRVETIFGEGQFTELFKQMESYKANGVLEQFKERCLEDSAKLSEYLTYFLEDDEMTRQYPMTTDDKEGWRIMREMSDMITCLNYFAGIRM